MVTAEASDLLSSLFARRDRGGHEVETDLALMCAEPTVGDLQDHFCVGQSAMISEGFLRLRRSGNAQPANAECLSYGRLLARARAESYR